MIIMRLMGGLGNQMFQYALGRRLALERGVPVKLDVSWFSNQSKRSYRLDKFLINADVATGEEAASITKAKWRSLSARIYQAVQRRLSPYRRAVVKEQKSDFDQRILRVRNNSYLVGYWQSEKYFLSIANILLDEFNLKSPLSQNSIIWAEKIQSCNSVSIHIRRGDYVSEPEVNQVHGVLSVDYYQDSVRYLYDHLGKIKLFVFSDNIQWVRQNLGFLKSPEFVMIEGERRDEEELLLMRLCKHHVIANSSYSWWGAWLGTCPEKIVVAPREWFKDPSRSTKDLIPDTWLRM